ncbi:MBL fold metallo-hydrolase [Pseudoxanthobacter sp.]|uniref:MBL fold metallo-hydrolase n=1 Tax=Pseudoxanthobacter sp. TaxID=1925742 RepID=UPI002FE0152A
MAAEVRSVAAAGEPAAARLARPRAAGVGLLWLGQAGFVLSGRHRLVIDPYLSDSLAEKYRGTPRPHVRMMPPPVSPAGLGSVDLVLCTHQHTDHMDPGTLQPLAALNPALRFVVPRAAQAEALKRTGAGADRLILLDAGETVTPLEGVTITAARAAHETLERDAAGCHRFLGYLVAMDGVRLFHSGDTVPFPGQVADVAALRPDVVLLPVNGRSAALAAGGVPGNLTLDEAVALAQAAGAPAMVAHHYGLFDFNTADPAAIDACAAQVTGLQLERARTDRDLAIRPRA